MKSRAAIKLSKGIYNYTTYKMAKVKRKFGPVEPLDREKMRQWMAEVGVVEVAVSEEPNGDTYMQRVGLINIAMLGVKKRFQKVPKNKK